MGLSSSNNVLIIWFSISFRIIWTKLKTPKLSSVSECQQIWIFISFSMWINHHFLYEKIQINSGLSLTLESESGPVCESELSLGGRGRGLQVTGEKVGGAEMVATSFWWVDSSRSVVCRFSREVSSFESSSMYVETSLDSLKSSLGNWPR